MYVERKNLKVGEVINAPGAPRGYTYGSALVCPRCGHKTMVFRPRRKVWVCYYKDMYSTKCSFESMVYMQPRRSIGDIREKSDYYDKLPIDVCSDLVNDVLGEDLAANHVDEVCGGQSSKSGGKGRSGKSSFLPYDTDKMKKYRQKYLAGT